MLMKKNNLSKIQNLVINIGAFTTAPLIYGFGTNLSKKYENVPMYIGTIALTIMVPYAIKKTSIKMLEKKKEKNKEE